MSIAATGHNQRLKQRARLQHCASCQAREVRLTSHFERFRAKGRLEGRSVEPSARWDVSNTQGLEVDAIRTPNQAIPPGGAFEVEVDVLNRNETNFGLTLDQDACELDSTPCGGSGFCVTVDVSVGRQSQSVTECISTAGPFGPNRKTYTATITAPQTPGEHTVTARGLLPGSGNRSQPISDTMTVAEGATPVTEDGDGAVPAGGAPFRPFLCVIEPQRGCTTAETVSMGGAGLLVALLTLL